MLIIVIGNYLQHEIKSAEKHKDVYLGASDMKSVDHNLAILPPSVCLLVQTIVKSETADL